MAFPFREAGSERIVIAVPVCQPEPTCFKAESQTRVIASVSEAIQPCFLQRLDCFGGFRRLAMTLRQPAVITL
jgi:predicted phosphoribosyltransferase